MTDGLTPGTILRSEIWGTLLGYHDQERFTAVLGAHDDPTLIPLTLWHEAQHHHLNTGSTFGILLTTTAKALRAADDPIATRALEAGLQQLVSRCDVTHETWATFGSCLLLDRMDVMDRLPKSYRDALRTMESILTRVSGARMWRLSAAWHLSRIAMLTETDRRLLSLTPDDVSRVCDRMDESIQRSPNARLELIGDRMQSFDLDAFRTGLRTWGMSLDYITAFFEEDSPAAIATRLGRTEADWFEVQDELEFAAMHAFLDMFEEHLPGLEEAHSQVSLLRSLQFGSANLRRRRSDE